jgi:hypothetical protein
VRSARLALVAVLAVGALGVVGSAGHTSCASPDVEVRPRRAATLSEITVVGHHWAVSCNDTCGGSCESCGGKAGRVANLHVVLIGPSGERRVLAGDLEADREYRVLVRLTLPEDLEPGPYKVQLVNDRHRAAQAARLTIVSG